MPGRRRGEPLWRPDPGPYRRLAPGTGRFNISQGALATAQGGGSAISATVAGLIIVNFSYAHTHAFLVLASMAGLGFGLYLAADA